MGGTMKFIIALAIIGIKVLPSTTSGIRNSFYRTPSISLEKCSTPNTSYSTVVRKLLSERYQPSHCGCFGSGHWKRLAFLDMSDVSQQCPSNWKLQSGTSYRGCGKSSPQLGCDSAIISSSNFTYNKVCGKVIGYQKGSTDAFDISLSDANNIEEEYVDGVSLTHGDPGTRQHIWTFAAAYEAKYSDKRRRFNCQCTHFNFSWPYDVPTFVDNHYFCETGNVNPGFTSTHVYSDDPLWDGLGCGPSSSCCQFNSPPWFCASLPVSTSDDLELRICTDQPRKDEDVIVSLIEIYVSLS